MEQKLDEYSEYQKPQLQAMKDDIIQKMRGCSYSCKFCNTQCQMGYHDETKNHSCDEYGHNLRVFAYGVFQSENGTRYPSLQTCNLIPPTNTIKINNKAHQWTEI